MCAWGVAAFENDDASDWVYELEETDTLDLIIKTIAFVVEHQNGYIEAPESQRTVAAIEVLATLHDGQSKNITEDVATWIQAHNHLDGIEHISLAIESLEIIGQNSELNELYGLWQESDDFDEWLSYISHLMQRLKQSQGN